MFYLISHLIISNMLSFCAWLHLEGLPCVDLSNDGMKIGLWFMLMGFFNLALFPIVEMMDKRGVAK